MTPYSLPGTTDRQLAVFVGGAGEALSVVEPILSGRAYDVEFVDPGDEPYGTILALKPDIVVVSLHLEDDAGFQLLTMLRLDPNTAHIPVLSYVQDDEVSAMALAGVSHRLTRLPAVLPSRAQRH